MTCNFCFRPTSMGLYILLLVEILRVLGSASRAHQNHEKINSDLHDKFKTDAGTQGPKTFRVEAIVELRGLSEKDNHKSISNAHHGIQSVLGKLREKAQNPQGSRSPEMTTLVHELQEEMTKNLNPVLELLDQLDVPSERLWATGEVYIREASWDLIEKIAEIEEVVRVRSPVIIPRPKPPTDVGPASTITQRNTTWSLNQINARCSEITCLGEGVTVGFIDSGVRATHEELRDSWVGMPYGFYDAGRPANCTPRDDDIRGTFITGIAVGGSLGVAPKAKWMMCLALGDGYTDAAIKTCMQYMFCPWKCGDTSDTKVTKNCSMRPDVINNSWFTGGKLSDDSFYPLLELWNAVGIVSVFAAGNEGPSCTSGDFPASYDIALSVGALDKNVTLPYFSAVGPALSRRPLTPQSTATGTCKRTWYSDDPHGTLCSLTKPDLVAPGVKINASVSLSDTSYAAHSGTDAAAPQVAGILALMMCANPHLRWDYKLAHKLLTTTADTTQIKTENVPDGLYGHFAVDTNLMCNALLSKIPCNQYPNNLYGYGLANACGAVRAARMEFLNADDLIPQFVTNDKGIKDV